MVWIHVLKSLRKGRNLDLRTKLKLKELNDVCRNWNQILCHISTTTVRCVATHKYCCYVSFASDLSIRLAVESYGNHQEIDPTMVNEASTPKGMVRVGDEARTILL